MKRARIVVGIAGALLALPVRLFAQPDVRIVAGGEGDKGASFARVRDVVVLGDRFVVLDGDAPFLRLFASDGRLIQTTGRRGGGPGEFQSPFSLHFDEASRRLLVVDPQNARVTILSIGDSLAHRESWSVTAPALEDVCRLGPSLVGIETSDPALLHTLSVKNRIVTAVPRRERKQSAHPLASHRMMLGYMGNGPMACSDNGTALVASRFLGEVVMVAAAGGEVRRLSIPGFRGLDFSASGGDGITLSVPKGKSYDTIDGVRALGNGFAITMAHRVAAAPREETVRDYWTVSLSRSGTFSVARRSAWRAVGRLGTGALCFRDEPVATLGVVSATECP